MATKTVKWETVRELRRPESDGAYWANIINEIPVLVLFDKEEDTLTLYGSWLGLSGDEGIIVPWNEVDAITPATVPEYE